MGMKRICLLSIVLCPIFLHAQGIQTLMHDSKSLIRLPNGPARVVQGKILPNLERHIYHEVALDRAVRCGLAASCMCLGIVMHFLNK